MNRTSTFKALIVVHLVAQYRRTDGHAHTIGMRHRIGRRPASIGHHVAHVAHRHGRRAAVVRSELDALQRGQDALVDANVLLFRLDLSSKKENMLNDVFIN